MKTKRQEKVLEIIAAEPIETQEQLLEALRAAGMSVTQATISRDIKELHLVKSRRGAAVTTMWCPSTKQLLTTTASCRRFFVKV